MKIKHKIHKIISGVLTVVMAITAASGIMPEWLPGAEVLTTVASADGYEMTAEQCIAENGSHYYKLDSSDYDAGMQRFQLQKHCTRCGFDMMSYYTARYLVQPYVGYYDGEEHGIYFTLPTDPAGGENDDRSDKVGLGGNGIHGNAPSGKFYKADPSDAFTEDPITRSDVGYTPVIWKVWFRLDVSRCVDEYDTIMHKDGWVNGYAEGASYILILDNEDYDNSGSGSGGNGSNGSSGSNGSNGSNGIAGSGGSIESTLEQLHSQGTHTEDMYHYHHTELATCERDGFDVFECRYCGKTISRNYYPQTGHTYDTYIVKDATCDDEGIIVHECTWCRDTYTETIPARGHSYKSSVTPATCKTGLQITKYLCIECGEQYEDSVIVDVPHTWHTDTVTASCTTEGVINSTCTVCGITSVQKTSDALGHDWDEGRLFSAETSESLAKWEYTCKRCDVKRYADAAAVTGCLAGKHKYQLVDNSDWCKSD